MSKAIYQPSGKAREYALWACNLHVGCSNDCTYCYCKRGPLGSVMGKPQATLKKCFKDENDAFLTFQKELVKNREAIIREGGLFFSFSTDPCLPENIELTLMCVALATGMEVPCSILTKRADWINKESDELDFLKQIKELVSVGFSFSGWPPAEPGASPERERITAMMKCHKAGIRTFASFEPILDIHFTKNIIREIFRSCDEFKFGLLSGDEGKTVIYKNRDLLRQKIEHFVKEHDIILKAQGKKVLWKKSIVNLLGEEKFKAVTVPEISDDECAVISAIQGKDAVEGFFPEEIAAKVNLTGETDIESLCRSMKERDLLDDFHSAGHSREGAYYPTNKGQAAMYQKKPKMLFDFIESPVPPEEIAKTISDEELEKQVYDTTPIIVPNEKQ